VRKEERGRGERERDPRLLPEPVGNRRHRRHRPPRRRRPVRVRLRVGVNRFHLPFLPLLLLLRLKLVFVVVARCEESLSALHRFGFVRVVTAAFLFEVGALDEGWERGSRRSRREGNGGQLVRSKSGRQGRDGRTHSPHRQSHHRSPHPSPLPPHLFPSVARTNRSSRHGPSSRSPRSLDGYRCQNRRWRWERQGWSCHRWRRRLNRGRNREFLRKFRLERVSG
jgi:hypothetical protein